MQMRVVRIITRRVAQMQLIRDYWTKRDTRIWRYGSTGAGATIFEGRTFFWGKR
jgi:hypothetical protein